MERVTAAALVPLVLYLVFAFLLGSGADYYSAKAWVSHPLNALVLLLGLAVGFLHAALGLQAIIEDYVSARAARLALLALARLGLAALAAASMYSVATIVFGGA